MTGPKNPFDEAIAVHRRMCAELLRSSDFQQAFRLNRYGAEQLLGYLDALFESALLERVEGSENGRKMDAEDILLGSATDSDLTHGS